MNKPLIAALLSTLTWMTAYSQDTIPHVQGEVTISVKKGTIECDLTLSNMPRLSNYYLRLNSGMNIRYIKNAEGAASPLPYDRSSQDTLSSGESTAYYIPAYNKSGKYLPHAIRFNYVGMYPVITDTTSVVDWRGNIAFNGKTLRADGIQGAWCPILYDATTDTRYEKVTYDLDVTCNDCQVIYVNGSQPVSGTHAHVISTASQDLTMFAGDFRSVSIDGNYFLNPDADDQKLAQLEKVLHSYQDYLEKKIGIPYKGKAVYIQTTPVSKNNGWLFASYPTIVKVGWDEGFKSFAGNKDGSGLLQYMSHELSHYYFGDVRVFNSDLGDMLSEGFAEFLKLNITRTLISDSIYRADLQSKVRAMRNFKPTPIANIHSKYDYGDRELYVYYYAPLLFSALEKEIEEDKMWEWIRALLQSPMVFTNYTFIEETLSKVVNNETRFAVLREKYFTSDHALQNAITTLNIPTDALTPAEAKDTATKTYYYFFFSGPMIDAGSSQNRVIKHTEIQQITCTREELSKMARPIFKKIADECENEAGCSSDFNTYDSMEKAQAALQRWLKRRNKDGVLVVKILTP
ncbi:M1 aminopeptidase family protein [Dinghuibacter silviterrae]|uniref:Metalloprotease with PDZ domain n=1 Tax=Dinghuibacter silviterrae TaxID=1539049 RepID=A0A4R8DSJ9_9BACT|nr:hypothetical protein [Dinghuibacter silviterrae]TDX00385.1 hypothetical protein EDB95_1407 [Dinghuibacter silviterrae]